MIRVVIEEHAAEAAVLFSLRSSTVHAPDRDVVDVCDLDERIEAHLDGLRIGGRGAARLLERTLDDAGPGEIFTAAVLAFESRDQRRVSTVLDAVCAYPSLATAAAAAIGWLSAESAAAVLRDLSPARADPLRLLAIAGAAHHRMDPGGLLRAALIEGDVATRARALYAVGELGLVSLANEVQVELEADEADCRYSAAYSAALLGHGAVAAPVLRAIAESDSPGAERACRWAAHCMNEEEVRDWVARLVSTEKPRLAVIAAGASGDVALLSSILPWTRVEGLARIAAEAFTMITGIEVERDLIAARPPGSHGGPDEDPEHEDVAMDPDEGLPWPDAGAVAARFETKAGLPAGPLLLGRAREPSWLVEVLRRGRQRQRDAAAWFYTSMSPGRPLFDICAPGPRQLRELSRLETG